MTLLGIAAIVIFVVGMFMTVYALYFAISDTVKALRLLKRWHRDEITTTDLRAGLNELERE